jgi:hypothetical protein
MRSRHSRRLPALLGALAAVAACCAVSAPSAAAATPSPGWAVSSLADPTNFAQADNAECVAHELCDRYVTSVTNAGGEASAGTVTILDTLPKGLKAVRVKELNYEAQNAESHEWGEPAAGFTCALTEIAPAPEEQWQAKCEYSHPVPAGDTLLVRVDVEVTTPADTEVTNEVKVTGGGAVAAQSGEAGQPQTAANTVNGATPSFGVQDFSFSAYGVNGAPDVQVGDHPNSVTATFDLTSLIGSSGFDEISPVQWVKNVVVYLPLGFVGDPLAAPTCPESQLINDSGASGTGCPSASRVGEVMVAFEGRHDSSLTEYESSQTSALYNITPEHGYPAELGFVELGKGIVMQASVVPSAAGDALRIAAPGIVRAFEITGVSLTIFGDPAQHDLNANGEPTVSPSAFLTNPVSCSASPSEETAKLEVDSWEQPGRWVDAESPPVYQAGATGALTGCDMLQFDPSIEMRPETQPAQADEPSGYTFNLGVPQAPNAFPALATPELRDAEVTLPEGVSVSPGGADGLVGCPASGPEGIDLGSHDALSHEVQEGEELGVDGLPHAAPGHCPLGSQIGTVKIKTPLLGEALEGRVYLAEPQCGGSGQEECTEAKSENGGIFGLYLEAEGSGVIVKLAGTVEAGGYGPHSLTTGLKPGQLRARFDENPQLPFSSLELHFKGGARAPLSNPQACGTFTTTSTLEPWGAPETPSATPSFPFAVTGCEGDPFSPGFLAQAQTPLAGAFTPFTVTFSRKDREQDLAGITLQTPPGLLGSIAGVPECGEAQANAGTCGPESQIGTTAIAAGAGSHPYVLSGRVYLTGPYKGAPFGLSVVVPAVAGPFNLGDEVVRASIAVNPQTAALTITSNPLPQIKDGVPFRLQTVSVEVNRPGFMFNPTNCDQQAVTGTITSAQGASAGVSSPFAVAGCAALPFTPKLTASVSGHASKANGASFDVKIGSAGLGQANIHKVDLQLPSALPSRLTTLQKACLEAVFNANPASCGPESVIGKATIHTPVLNSPLTGPAYLVSHGGAAFPDVEFVLQGEGVTLILDGKTDIKNGITYSRFETAPDAPFTSFETELSAGPHSILTAYVPTKENYSLCWQTLAMPTVITGQDGAQIKQSTEISVTGCKAAIKVVKKKRSGGTVSLTLRSTVAGTLTITGGGVKKANEKLAAGEHQIKVALTNAGRRRKKIKLKIILKSGKSTLSKAVTL